MRSRSGRESARRADRRTRAPAHTRPRLCSLNIRQERSTTMSGALPITAVQPQALPTDTDSVLTLRPAPKTHVTVRGLSKRFAGKPLYTNFNLDLPRGKIVSIFGPNGCGKSTLMNMIAGLLPLDAGEILFDGKSLKDTKIGYVFQNYRDAL